MPKQKREETGYHSEQQKLQRIYTRGTAAYGSVLNLANATKLPFSKVRQFLHSKDSYTKFTLATRKFRFMRASARYKNELWCKDLAYAYVDKLANDNRGTTYLLVRQEVFDKTKDVKRLKTKDSKQAFRAFEQMSSKRKRSQSFRLTREKEMLVNLKRDEIQIHSTLSEPQAATNERAIRSLKKYYIATMKTVDTSIITNCLNLLLRWIREGIDQ